MCHKIALLVGAGQWTWATNKQSSVPPQYQAWASLSAFAVIPWYDHVQIVRAGMLGCRLSRLGFYNRWRRQLATLVVVVLVLRGGVATGAGAVVMGESSNSCCLLLILSLFLRRPWMLAPVAVEWRTSLRITGGRLRLSRAAAATATTLTRRTTAKSGTTAVARRVWPLPARVRPFWIGWALVELALTTTS
jgi:hypothetical protein